MKEVKTMTNTKYLRFPIFSDNKRFLTDIGIQTDSVQFSTRYGKWSIIDFCTAISESVENRGVWMKHTDYCCVLALFEHDTLGDMTDYVLAYYDCFSGDNCWKEIAGTYDDIQTALIDNEIVEA